MRTGDGPAADWVPAGDGADDGAERAAAGVARRMAGTLADTAVPPPGSDSISSCPVSRRTRWRIVVSPKPPPARPACRPRTRRTRRAPPVGQPEAHAVVADVERHHVVHVGQGQPDAADALACLATLARASCATRSSVTSTSGCRPCAVPGGGDRRGDAIHRGPAVRHLGQRVGQPGVLQRLRADGPDRPAGLGQAVPGQPGGVPDPPFPVGAVAGTGAARAAGAGRPGLAGLAGRRRARAPAARPPAG